MRKTKPVVAIYSTFLQRAYDQLIHDVALQNLDVLFAIDRAGLVGEDGPTHAGSFDLSYLRCIPNMVVMTPSDEDETYKLLTTGYLHTGPAAVRYPRGKGPGATIQPDPDPVEIGRAVVRRKGQAVAILAFGSMVTPAAEAAESLNATLVDMRFVKPLDEDLIGNLARSHDLIVTVEENTIMGVPAPQLTNFWQHITTVSPYSIWDCLTNSWNMEKPRDALGRGPGQRRYHACHPAKVQSLQFTR